MFSKMKQLTRPALLLAALFVCTMSAMAQAPITGTGTISGFGEFDSGPGIIPATLFGMHFRFNNTQQTTWPVSPVITWPGVPFGSLRLWDTDTRWQNLNPNASGPNQFAFASLDQYLAAAQANGVSDVLMTLSSTPSWAAAVPTQSGCDYQYVALGDCSPPADLEADGTGTDQHWRDYIYALGTHIAGLNPSTNSTVKWFEMWNEFTRGVGYSPASWLGTNAELVRMAQDADCILTGRGTIAATSQTCTAVNMNEAGVALLPTARVLTPDSSPQLTPVIGFGQYLSTTGALNSVDEIAVHAYSFNTDAPDATSPEGIGSNLTGQGPGYEWDTLAAQLPANAFGLPIWSTEGSWGQSSGNLPDPDMESGYIARYFLVGWSAGYRRLYWYAYANSWGKLANQNGDGGCFDSTGHGCYVASTNGDLVVNGWNAVYSWMVGSEMTTGCAPKGNIWTCGLVARGNKELAVWDASQACSAGVCTTSNYSYPAGYGHYTTLDDNPVVHPIHTLSGGTVAIGWKPILLTP